MNYGIGDIVHVDNRFIGVVSKIKDNFVTVKCNDGKERVVTDNTLVLVVKAMDTVAQMRGAILYAYEHRKD